MRPPGVRVDDVAAPRALRRDRKPLRPRPFRQRAVRRTNDELRVPQFTQSASQGKKGLLPAAPGGLSIDVSYGEGGQIPIIASGGAEC